MKIPSLDVVIPWRDQALSGRLFRPAAAPASSHPLPAALFIHGWSGHQDANDVQLAAAMAQRGFVALTFDLAGHGLSVGIREQCTATAFLEQTIAACDLLRAQPGVDPRRVSLCGSSLGAYLALLVAAERPVANLSLRVPANYPDEIHGQRPLAEFVNGGELVRWRARALDAGATRSLRALQAYRGNLQLIEAGRDEVIPRQTIENYLHAAGAVASLDHLRLADATHTVYEHLGSRRAAIRAVSEWLVAHRNDLAAAT